MMRVPRPKGPNDAQLTFNLPGGWVDELDRLAENLSRPGLAVTRTDALRLAVRKGIDALAHEKGEGRRAPEDRKSRR
jgi:hypothetical protein